MLWKNWVHPRFIKKSFVIPKKKVLWPRWGLNPQTSDLKSNALPTELSGMC